MDMKKNYILATVLIGLVVTGNIFLQKKFAPQPTKPVIDVDESTKTEKKDEKNVEVVKSLHEAEVKDNVEEKIYVIETDLIEATLTNRGGDIVSYKLKQHNVSESTESVEMIKNISDYNRALSISLGKYGSPIVNNTFNASIEESDSGEKLISFIADVKVPNKDSVVRVGKYYRFIPGEYMFELVITMDGVTNESYTLRSAPQIGPTWNKSDRYDFRRFASYVNGKYKRSVVKAGQEKNITDPTDWSAVSGKYFTFVVIPESPIYNVTYSANMDSSIESDVENSQVYLTTNAHTGSSQDVYRIYIGPSSEKVLHNYSNPVKNKFGYSKLRIDEISSSSGVLSPVITVLKILLQFTYGLVNNWGVAIILVTIFIKIVLFPLSWKTMLGTQKLQPYQPMVQEVQAKYKNNPQKMQVELNKIYAEAGYKPGCVGGCLPYLLQFAVIIAMFQLFNNYFEFRGASFIDGWISDLSAGDSVFKFKNPLPFVNWTDLRLLPIIYVASQYLSTLLNKQPVTEQTKSMMFAMMYVMPGVLFFVLYNAPSGLFVYWIISNIFMIIQQLVIKGILVKEKAKK